MTLSNDVRDVLVDLIKNRIDVMHIGDRDDLRERVALQKALIELQALDPVAAGIVNHFGEIPRRGRRRKVSDMIEERG